MFNFPFIVSTYKCNSSSRLFQPKMYVTNRRRYIHMYICMFPENYMYILYYIFVKIPVDVYISV